MAKRNVAYIKPDEPAFLKRIKQQIGYQEVEDEINVKRGPIQNLSDDDEDYEDKDDEKPQVVQLREGDLTEAEAKKILKEEEEKPADLNQKIVFKSKKKKDETGNEKSESSSKPKSKKSSQKEKPSKSLLSFEDEDDE